MIDDIVELPRQLQYRRTGATLASYRAYEPPVSEFGLATGLSTEIKDFPICEGNEFDLIVGKETPYRYKFIEHDEKFIREFVAIADGPISSKDTKVFTLWVNKVDKTTLKVEKYYMWDVILMARKYFGMQACTMLSRSTQDDMTFMGVIEGMPGLSRAYRWAHQCFEQQSFEESELFRMRMLLANMNAMNDAHDFGMMYHPMDVLRGVSKEDVQPYRFVTGAGRILSRNSIESADIKRMLGPDFATRPYQSCLKSPKPLENKTVVDAMNEFSGWFEVLKYIELIPYSESFTSISYNHIDVMRVYDPYDRMHIIDVHDFGFEKDEEIPKYILDDEHLDGCCRSLLRSLDDLITDPKQITIYRSWGEEVYITITNQDRSTRRFYFDLVHAAIGSRMFEPVNNENQTH